MIDLEKMKVTALTAIDEMDDYARMDIGVDPIGPREVITSAVLELIEQNKALEAENERDKEGVVCGDCDGSGWLENRVEGRHPCTCMTEAEPYQLLEAERDELKRQLAEYKNQSCCAVSPNGRR